ncbi:Crp/Fnr family transcriptional regulator [Polaribacter vadi]|uniref:Crp/Fnr family transcriptional regulator n=1 Tax=Polaribacter TaxID=52959 RepID=UPI001C07EF25|nr:MULTISPECIES: Crp/Fnr family transcriptional regulator [Polaribacter]MBU3012516.1 Crp/Fnr family transcriptional regulator [Polaribacter vadi]MDO6742333.1 Crp/Fnr family transcriptional regulator [Polaribacter sp. 1_MG-2023]
MNLDTSILSQIFKNVSFSKDEKICIENKLEKLTLKKGTTILKAGDTVFNQYYVFDGCLRTYYIDNSGKEHTLQFAINDWWISDYTAFFTSSKAIMHIETIQNATLYKISKENMEILYKEIPQLETFFRKKMERAFTSFQKRILASLSQSAKERYLSFITTYPNIEQNVKNFHIASYLGITTESLSRIRKEIAQN